MTNAQSGEVQPEIIVPQAVGQEATEEATATDYISSPSKVLRIGSMIKTLLDEVKGSNLDEASRTRMREIYESAVRELSEGMSADLVAELKTFSLPFDEEQVPTEAELRIAQAQLVGWLEGLFHGIQATLFAQQMSARSQLEEMRGRELAPGGRQVPPGGGTYL